MPQKPASQIPKKVLEGEECVSNHLYCPHSSCRTYNPKTRWDERSKRVSMFAVTDEGLVMWWACPTCKRTSPGFIYRYISSKGTGEEQQSTGGVYDGGVGNLLQRTAVLSAAAEG